MIKLSTHNILSVLLLILAFHQSATVFAANTDKQAVVDSLVSEALDMSRHGRFLESNQIFDGLLHDYRFSRNSKRTIYQWMGANAMLEGDYVECRKYLVLQGRNKKKDAVLKFCTALASLPKETAVRPDNDIVIPYSIDSLYFENKFKGCLIRIPVNIGGKDEMMIIDNGCAYYSAVSDSFAREHGIRPVDASITTIGTVGKANSGMGIADSISIGGMVFKNILFQIIPDESVQNPVTDLNAVLGANFFRLAGEMDFDNKDRTITFPVTQHEMEPDITINDEGQHFMDVVVDCDTLKFQLDLGATRTSLSSNYFNKNEERIVNTCAADTISIGGVGGMTKEKIYTMENVEFLSEGGSYLMSETSVHTCSNPAEDDEDGSLGNDFLLSFDKAVLNLRKMFLYSEIETDL